jgi:hypothetical protein
VFKVLDALPSTTPVSGCLVWVRVLEGDNQEAAQKAADQMTGQRLRHFYDPKQRAAREMAAVLGGPGSFAWDTYLVFSTVAAWEDEPPQPDDWVHQLDHAAWAPSQRRKTGEALLEAIQRMIGER